MEKDFFGENTEELGKHEKGALQIPKESIAKGSSVRDNDDSSVASLSSSSSTSKLPSILSSQELLHETQKLLEDSSKDDNISSSSFRDWFLQIEQKHRTKLLPSQKRWVKAEYRRHAGCSKQASTSSVTNSEPKQLQMIVSKEKIDDAIDRTLHNNVQFDVLTLKSAMQCVYQHLNLDFSKRMENSPMYTQIKNMLIQAVSAKQHSNTENQNAPITDSTFDVPAKRAPLRCIPTRNEIDKSEKPVAKDPASSVENLNRRPKQASLCTDQPRAAETKPATRKRTRSAAGPTKRCTLCKNCPCTFEKESKNAFEMIEQQRKSDSAIEKDLIKRLATLEKTADRYAEQEETIRRRLKKHRRDLYLERRKVLNQRTGAQDSRPYYFLPDAHEMEVDEMEKKQSLKLPPEQVEEAVERLFPESSKAQPTLTQMFCQHQEVGSDTGTPEPDDQHEIETNAGSKRGEFDYGSDADEYETDSIGEIKASRVSWSDGLVQSPNRRGLSMWMAVAEGNSSCSFDQFFEDAGESYGLDELVGMLGLSQPLVETHTHDGDIQNDENRNVTLSMLSHDARATACETVRGVERDEERLKLLEEGCPMWRENVRYALHQRSPSEVEAALFAVRERKTQAEIAKENMLQAFRKKLVLLDLYEESLSMSLDLLQQKNLRKS